MTIADTVYEKLKAAPPEIAKEVLDFLEFLEAKAQQKADKPENADKTGRSWDEFFGNLKDSKVFEGDPVEIQRKLRSEWDRDWDPK